GEPAAALAAFAEFERRLEAEYGLSPSAETVRLVERLRAPRVEPPASEPAPARRAVPPRQVEAPAPVAADPPAPAVADTPAPPAGVEVAAPAAIQPEPAPPSAHRAAPSRRRWARLAAAAVVMLMVVAGGWLALGRRSAAAAPAEPPAIAVLPFVNLSGDPENDYFSDGLAEELLNVLAQLPELRVAARTSSFRYRGNEVPVDSIGRALRVGHVLEGSVRQYGPRVRITAQLIETRTGFHLWSATYDRELKDVFAIQDEISRAIVEQLQVRLTGERATGRLARQETADPQAHALVLKGGYVLQKATRETNAQAVAFAEEAIRRDPRYARAYALLAEALQFQAYRRYVPPGEGYARAKAMAQRALALDPSVLRAHVALARIAELHEWDFRSAEEHYRQAIELSPHTSVASYTPRAFLLMRLGRPTEAIAAARRYTELVPDRPSGYNNLGALYGFARQYDQAIEAFQSARALEAENASAAIGLALTYSYLGRHPEALAAAEQLRRQRGDDQHALGAAGYVYARAGRRADAQQALAALQAQPDASRYVRASIHVGLNDRDRAFALLEEAVQAREGELADLGIDPSFDPLRGDPRMGRLLRRIGLPAAE
ncbi:MAG TPA: hypothetical protein VHG08_06520, partial [Longimicrobium sp.]|nr:hypothetical protein [Longimicrobium sp.]